MKIFLTGSNGYIGSEFIKAASKKNYIFAVTRKKKNKRIKNVKWLVGSIDKKWHQLKKSDVLVHLATDGGYERFPKFKKCYNFNFIKSKKHIHKAYYSGCRKWIIATTKKEKQFKNFSLDKKTIKKYEKKPDLAYAFLRQFFQIIV